MFLYIQKNLIDQVDLCSVCRLFITVNYRRTRFFAKNSRVGPKYLQLCLHCTNVRNISGSFNFFKVAKNSSWLGQLKVLQCKTSYFFAILMFVFWIDMW